MGCLSSRPSTARRADCGRADSAGRGAPSTGAPWLLRNVQWPRSHFPYAFMRFTHRGPAPRDRNDIQTIKSLLPYVWEFKWRVIAALGCLVAAKVASVILPLYLKQIVDQLSVPENLLVLPLAALLGYGFARLASGVFGELRDALFARVTQGSIRRIAARLFRLLVQNVIDN